MDQNPETPENKSKRKLVESGKSLFYSYGYRKVTVEDICGKAGLSKMTFYRFFTNKLELITFILNELTDQGTTVYREIMDREAPFEEKIRETIRMKSELAKQFSDEFLRDVYSDKKGEILPLIQKLTDETMVMVMNDYLLAQQQGHIRSDLNLSFIPYFTKQMQNMTNDPALVELCHGNIKEVLTELTNLFFYGILQQHEKNQENK